MTQDPLLLLSRAESVDLGMALDAAIREYRDRRKSCIRLALYCESAFYYERIERFKALNCRMGFANPVP